MRHSVLLVDDEQSVRSALRRTLRKNYDVLEAENGQQALRLLANNKINVVLSDQRMPGMTGTQLLKIVKDKHPSVRRIMVSGHSDVEDLNQAINEANIFRFIPKPWNNDNLSAIVSEAITPQARKDTKASTEVDKYTLANALQKSISNDELELEFTAVNRLEGQPNHLDKSEIFWPLHSHLKHQDIISIAYKAGFARDLYTWYLLKNIDSYNSSTKKYRQIIIDIFHNKPTERNYLHKLFSISLKQGYNFILKISAQTLQSSQINDLLIEIYNTNTKLLLTLDNLNMPIQRLENIPVSYVEMRSFDAIGQDSEKTEAHLKFVRQAHNLSIKTILSNVCEERQLLYAKTMEFDFFSTK